MAKGDPSTFFRRVIAWPFWAGVLGSDATGAAVVDEDDPSPKE